MAAQDYDSQLLESVSVRRRRLRDALVFGAQRQRRSLDERLGKVFAGVVIAAVLCAGCVGWSFVSRAASSRAWTRTSRTDWVFAPSPPTNHAPYWTARTPSTCRRCRASAT
ncbi:hypothetical protein [Streptomyces marianii]|uniref:hypothetical protein n=1 Tax=Streptomyces marianii TaxID=1817406 RepID=UPI001F163DC6|nr:hypothetical protein [Streptomyces marianii]